MKKLKFFAFQTYSNFLFELQCVRSVFFSAGNKKSGSSFKRGVTNIPSLNNYFCAFAFLSRIFDLRSILEQIYLSAKYKVFELF
jgi:hypothetical protein